jgi:hypothetical protein
MASSDRRRFLSGLTAAILGPMADQPRFSSERNTLPVDDIDLAHGCIFARQERDIGNHSVGPSVDFWTFRVSEIDCNGLFANPVIVWDEVFGWYRLKHAFQEILGIIPKFYGFDPLVSPNALAFHVDGKTAVDKTISSFLSDAFKTVSRPEVVLVDSRSCGLSRLEWHDIIPHLGTYYGMVIGFEHYPGRGPSDWSRTFDEGHSSPTDRSAMVHCTYSFATSDALIGFDDMPDCDVRSAPLNELLQNLADACSSTNFLEAIAKRHGTRSFAIGSLPAGPHWHEIERQRYVITSEFGALGTENPIMFDSRGRGSTKALSIWPFRPITSV